MQLIAVDIGNSSIKIGFPADSTVERENAPWRSQTVIRQDELIAPEIDTLPDERAFWCISSVNAFHLDRLTNWLSKNRPNDAIHLISHLDIPLAYEVVDVSRVGVDRLLAAWMAIQLNNGAGPVVAIDAGTAVTIDVVDRNKAFLGGLIFPGATNNLLQLSDSTSALPDLSAVEHLRLVSELKEKPIGDDTIPAIIKGVYSIQIAGINSITKSICDSWNIPERSVFATGGGISQISDFCPEPWNIVPDLVLRSIRDLGNELMIKAGFSSTSIE